MMTYPIEISFGNVGFDVCGKVEQKFEPGKDKTITSFFKYWTSE